MAHNITNGRDIAFMGDRNSIWHRLGQQMQPGQSIEEWAKAAGLDWNVVKVPAIYDLSGPQFAHLEDNQRVVKGYYHNVRNDTGAQLGYVGEIFKNVQPVAVLDWFQQYISVDPRFALDVAGSLKGGAIIWATATFRDDVTVGGDKHVARILMTTAYDGKMATVNQATMTRVVCNNTLNASLCDKRALIKTAHIAKFDAERVGKELAAIAQGFDSFKKVGDAMAGHHMPKDDLQIFFKQLLKIDPATKEAEIKGRKKGQFDDLNAAWIKTCLETEGESPWGALNAVTRYVDHDRSTVGKNVDEGRFASSQFGSGAAMKAQAVSYLTQYMDDPVALLAAAASKTDVTKLLQAPFRKQ